MTDNSRKLARRRAGVSVVSSTFSIRRDRCSASDLSIARRTPIVDFQFQMSQGLWRVLWPTGKSGKRYRALLPVHACRSSAFSGQVRGRLRGLRSAVRTHAGAESGFPLRATDGECPVQRLKAWLKEVDPSWHARQIARLDPAYPRLGGQVREPSAHGPSEVQSAIASKSTSRSSRMMSASNRAASRGLHICDAWRRHAVAR